MAVRRSPKFFITHSWRDNNFARRLTDDLKAKGLDGFFDVYSIQPGDNIPSRISSGLDDCDVYIPVLSATAFQSPWCEWEINAAIQLRNTRGRMGRPRIIPVVIDDCHGQIPVILRAVSYIDFTSRSYADSMRKLLQGMGVSVKGGRAKISESDETSDPTRMSDAIPNRKAWATVALTAAFVGLIVLGVLFFTDFGSQVLGFSIENVTPTRPLVNQPTSTSMVLSASSVQPTKPMIELPTCNDPQHIFISQPANGSTVSGTVDIIGSIFAQPFAQLYRYSLFYRPDVIREPVDAVASSQVPLTPDEPNGKNVPIAIKYFQPFDASIDHGVLGTWDTSKLTKGWYSLRLWSTDRSSSHTACDVYVLVK